MKKAHENQLHNKNIYKQEKLIYDFIPNTIKALPREQKPLTVPVNVDSDHTLPNEEIKFFLEWPEDEEARVKLT